MSFTTFVWPGFSEGQAKRNLLIFDFFMVSHVYPTLNQCDTGSVCAKYCGRDHSSLRETKGLTCGQRLQQDREQNILRAHKSRHHLSIPKSFPQEVTNIGPWMKLSYQLPRCILMGIFTFYFTLGN